MYQGQEETPPALPLDSPEHSPKGVRATLNVASFRGLIDTTDAAAKDAAAEFVPVPVPAAASAENDNSWLRLPMQFMTFPMNNKSALLVAAGLIGLTLALYAAAPPLIQATAVVVGAGVLMGLSEMKLPTWSGFSSFFKPEPQKIDNQDHGKSFTM